MLSRLRSTYFYICWIPLAIYLVSDFYISASTGWGQWAMGVVVLPPLLLSAAFLLTGALMVSDGIGKKEPVLKLLLATLVAGSVFIWFFLRSVILEYYGPV